MEYFQPAELRLVQERTNTSAADALLLAVNSAVPENKIWTVIAVGYRPSVAETQVVYFYKTTRSSNPVALLNPTSLNLNPGMATPLEQGMALILLPGEVLRVGRVAATGGSTMSAWMQFVEEDMPLYEYREPQLQKRIRQFGTQLQQRISSGGGGGGGSSPPAASRGGRSGPLSK